MKTPKPTTKSEVSKCCGAKIRRNCAEDFVDDEWVEWTECSKCKTQIDDATPMVDTI